MYRILTKSDWGRYVSLIYLTFIFLNALYILTDTYRYTIIPSSKIIINTTEKNIYLPHLRQIFNIILLSLRQ